MPDRHAPRAVGPSTPSTQEEHELIARLRTGDPSVLDAVLDLYWQPLVEYLRSLAGSEDEAEDLAQEAFLRFWSGRERWETGSSPRALIYRIGRNLALDSRKQAWRRVPLVRSGTHQSPQWESPLERTLAGELDTAVRSAIASLPPRRREAFELARYHDLSYSEIAETMEISPQTVANHVSAALTALRVALSPYIEKQSSAPSVISVAQGRHNPL